MHRVLTRSVTLALAGVTAFAAVLAGQTGNVKLAAVNEVVAFRVNWMTDSTPFNACSIYEAADRPADFPAGISEPLRQVLDCGAAPCESRSGGVPGAWNPEVVVDSVVVRGEAAAVFVTVRKGEISYFEQYSLVSGAGGRWSTQEVRIWGAMREYPARPPAQ